MGDKGKEKDGVIGYGAIGVGDTKMKIHKAAIAKLFERNDQVLDAEEGVPAVVAHSTPASPRIGSAFARMRFAISYGSAFCI